MTLSGWEQPPCFWERPLRQAPTRLWCVSASEDPEPKRHSGPAKHNQDYDEQSFPQSFISRSWSSLDMRQQKSSLNKDSSDWF